MIAQGILADIPSGPGLLVVVGLIFAMIGLAALAPAWIATALIGPRGAPFMVVPASSGFAAGTIAYLVTGADLELLVIGGAVVGGATLAAVVQRAAVGESGRNIGVAWRVVAGLIAGGSIGASIGLLGSVVAGSVAALLLVTGLGAIIGALIAARPRLSSSP